MNDPVNYSGRSGHSPDSIWETLLGAAVGVGFLSRSAVALNSKLYTMGPTIATGVGRGVTKFVGNYIGDWF